MQAFTNLHDAAKYGDVEAAARLIDEGASVDSLVELHGIALRGTASFTALHILGGRFDACVMP